ncbi:MAG: helicase C-terminal domain-containing protein [Coriobacteriia bacterium]|nr:helicase C-terminal domain-containing protein [Coriobacteriia bacterium]
MAHESIISFLQPGTDPEVAAAYTSLPERARGQAFGFEDEVAFVDLETTGFDPVRDEIIEMAVVIARGPEVLDRWSTLVRPTRPIPFETTQLTGIDDEMVAGAPSAASAGTDLARVVGPRMVIAHNAPFDRAFLEHNPSVAARLPGLWVDSLEVVRIALPRLKSHRLGDLARAFSLDPGCGHRAADDAETLFGVWRIALTALSDLPPAVLHELARLGASVPGWGAASLFSHLASGVTAPPFDLRRLRTERLRAERMEPLADAGEITITRPEVAAVLAEFEPGGLVERMYETYEPRAEQAAMAEAVLEAFGSNRSAAIEAGTGVGKSVAYLVPAVRFALANGIAVGVATKTNTLMDQLVHRELPRLDEALGGGLRFTALKGYDHYLCLRKVQRLLDAPLDQESAAALGMLVSWISQSTWGDRDGINLHWPSRLRQESQASFADCTKKRCRYYPNQCYLHGVRRQAASAHIVVTNHALLFRDLMADGGILPPIRHWVVDEAHAAEAEARDQLSVGTGHVEIRSLLGGLHTTGRGGLLDAIRVKVALGTIEDRLATTTAIDELRETVTEAVIIADSFFDFVSEIGSRNGSSYETAELRLTGEVRDGGAWSTAAGVGRSLAKRLERIIEVGKKVITALEPGGDELTENRADLAGRLSAIAGQHAGLTTVLDGTDDSYVYSATVDRRRQASSARLDAMLLDVGSALAEQFYPRLYSVVYTSATIAAGSDFSHFERALGLDRIESGGFRTLRLDSSYDFERQMAVFVPTGLPDPCRSSDRGYAAYISALGDLLLDVHRAMEGSVLTLFTNRRDMEELYRRLAAPLAHEGLRLLVQERGISRKRVAEEFIADERVSLFATKSFWEGFDAKGDTLRCVVVPRLPFGPINDPVLEERKERDSAWWEHYYLPEAVLELKQAAGRLIRSSSDRGCLVLADARLSGTKQYARRFLDALPVRDVERLPASDLGTVMQERFGSDTR